MISGIIVPLKRSFLNICDWGVPAKQYYYTSIIVMLVPFIDYIKNTTLYQLLLL